MELTTGPERIFKLCVADESARFQAAGTIRSELDAADGFIHLSDRTSAPVVAGLFFSTAKDLRLIELASSKLAPLSWVVGKMGDAAPTPAEGELAIHYLIPEGCVHVFGAGGVPTSAILREEAVPPSGRTASTSFLTGFRDWRICCPCSSFLNHHFSPGEAPLWPLWFGRGVS